MGAYLSDPGSCVVWGNRTGLFPFPELPRVRGARHVWGYSHEPS